MKTAELVAVPPGVVIAIFPVFAPVGTFAVTCVSEFTVTVVALTPPNVTFVVCVRLTPVMVTGVPTVPLVGVKLLIEGVTRKFILLFRLPLGIATVTMPVFAPAGIVAVRKVSDEIVNLAAVPLKETPVAPLNPCPRMPIDFRDLAGSRKQRGVGRQAGFQAEDDARIVRTGYVRVTVQDPSSCAGAK